MFGAHDFTLDGGGQSQFNHLVVDTLARLVEQGALSRLQSAKLEPAPQPDCKEDMSMTEWNTFLHSWKL